MLNLPFDNRINDSHRFLDMFEIINFFLLLIPIGRFDIIPASGVPFNDGNISGGGSNELDAKALIKW